MPKYIAFLRGINVGGRKVIKMERLRTVLSHAHFQPVQTYLQSGNVVFESNCEDRNDLQEALTTAISIHFGFDVPAILLTPEELKYIISNNPFKEQSKTDQTQPYVALLSKEVNPEEESTTHFLAATSESFAVAKNAIYIWYNTPPGKSKLTIDLIEKKLTLTATMRNWKTLQSLAQMTES